MLFTPETEFKYPTITE